MQQGNTAAFAKMISNFQIPELNTYEIVIFFMYVCDVVTQQSILSHDCPFSIFLMQKELASNPDCPQMCAYKLVTIKFKWWGLQSKVENFIQKVKSVQRVVTYI